MKIEKCELNSIYKEMKLEDPKLTVNEFIELVRGYNAVQLNQNDFEKYAVDMLLSTREVVKKEDEKKQPVQLGQ